MWLKQTGWRYSSRQFCYCVIGGVDVARRIGVLAPGHLAVRLLIRVDLVTHYRSPVDRSQDSRLTSPRSGLERSDFVLWPDSEVPTDGPAGPLIEVDLPCRRSEWHGHFDPTLRSPALSQRG